MPTVTITTIIELTDKEAKALTEIDTYCREGDYLVDAMPVQKLCDNSIAVNDIAQLLDKGLIYSESLERPYRPIRAGDDPRKFEVCVTPLGIETAKRLITQSE